MRVFCLSDEEVEERDWKRYEDDEAKQQKDADGLEGANIDRDYYAA